MLVEVLVVEVLVVVLVVSVVGGKVKQLGISQGGQ